MGSGIGSLDDVYDTTVAFEKGVSSISDCSERHRFLTNARAIVKCRLFLYLDCSSTLLLATSRCGMASRCALLPMQVYMLINIGAKSCCNNSLHDRRSQHRRCSTTYTVWRCRRDGRWRCRVLHPPSRHFRLCTSKESSCRLER